MKMNFFSTRKCLPFLLLCLCWCLSLSSAFAQVTSSGISGRVIDDKSEGIPGANVIVTHTPTGTQYGAATDVDGRFNIVNMRSGGPYSIKASALGYADQKLDNINLGLGTSNRFNFKLKEATTQLTEVVITGSKDDSKVGTATNIGKEQIQSLPTLSRSFSDFTKLTPQSSNNSFAGTNFRYNNITLDGAINNDAIGFSPSFGRISIESSVRKPVIHVGVP